MRYPNLAAETFLIHIQIGVSALVISLVVLQVMRVLFSTFVHVKGTDKLQKGRDVGTFRFVVGAMAKKAKV